MTEVRDKRDDRGETSCRLQLYYLHACVCDTYLSAAQTSQGQTREDQECMMIHIPQIAPQPLLQRLHWACYPPCTEALLSDTVLFKTSFTGGISLLVLDCRVILDPPARTPPVNVARLAPPVKGVGRR